MSMGLYLLGYIHEKTSARAEGAGVQVKKKRTYVDSGHRVQVEDGIHF